MGRVVGVLLGLLMVAAGALWTFQGLGWIGDSPMTDRRFWAGVGPAVAGLGVALVFVAARGPR